MRNVACPRVFPIKAITKELALGAPVTSNKIIIHAINNPRKDIKRLAATVKLLENQI